MLVRACLAVGAMRPRAEALAMSAVANFFDTLGISSFATTLAWMRVRRLVPDPADPADACGGLHPAHHPAVGRLPRPARRQGRPDPAGGLHRGHAGGRPGRGAPGHAYAGAGRAGDRRRRPLAGGDVLHPRQPEADAGRRRGDGAAAGADGGDHRGPLRAGRPDQFRGRQLRADAGDVEPVRHGPAPGVPDHGELGRLLHRRRQRAPGAPRGRTGPAGGARHGGGRDPGGADRGVRGARDAAGAAALGSSWW